MTEGDLTRSVEVEARGEVELLRDNINEMICNLPRHDADEHRAGLARHEPGAIYRHAPGPEGLPDSRPPDPLGAGAAGRRPARRLLPQLPAENGETLLQLTASYAYRERKDLNRTFREGEGLVGQVAFEKERILLTNVPRRLRPGQLGARRGAAAQHRGSAGPFEGQVMAVVELSSFNRFSETHLSFLDQLTESIGIVLNTIDANMRTEELLKQSQALTQELQQQQEELQQTNEELEEKARLLSEQNEEVERRRREIEEARATWSRRPISSRGPRGTSRSSWRTCRTSCARPEQPADPLPAARRQPGRAPLREGGRVRPNDPRLRRRP